MLDTDVINPAMAGNEVSDAVAWPSTHPDFELGGAKTWYAAADTQFANTTWEAGYHVQAQIEVFSCHFNVRVDFLPTGVTITSTLMEDID